MVEEEKKQEEKVEEKKEEVVDKAIEENLKVEEKEEKPVKIKKGEPQKPKNVLEREYIIPLRKEFKKVPEFRRAKRALKALKDFVARHMKVEDRNIKKVKIDKYLNEEIWFRGIRKPLAKIKVKCIKDSEGIVKVELVDIPDVVKFKMDREKKDKNKVQKVEKKVEEKKEEKTEEEKKGEKEKEKAGEEVGLKQAETQAKELKHEVKTNVKQPRRPYRQALQK